MKYIQREHVLDHELIGRSGDVQGQIAVISYERHIGRSDAALEQKRIVAARPAQRLDAIAAAEHVGVAAIAPDERVVAAEAVERIAAVKSVDDVVGNCLFRSQQPLLNVDIGKVRVARILKLEILDLIETERR